MNTAKVFVVAVVVAVAAAVVVVVVVVVDGFVRSRIACLRCLIP